MVIEEWVRQFFAEEPEQREDDKVGEGGIEANLDFAVTLDVAEDQIKDGAFDRVAQPQRFNFFKAAQLADRGVFDLGRGVFSFRLNRCRGIESQPRYE